MRSEFEPLRTEEAKKRLSRYLKEAEKGLNEQKIHYLERRKHRSLWQKFLGLFSK